MVSLTALWLSILLAAILVFVASSIIHMVLPYHRKNYRQLLTKTGFAPPFVPQISRPASTTFPFALPRK